MIKQRDNFCVPEWTYRFPAIADRTEEMNDVEYEALMAANWLAENYQYLTEEFGDHTIVDGFINFALDGAMPKVRD